MQQISSILGLFSCISGSKYKLILIVKKLSTAQDWYVLTTKKELTIFKESKYNKISNIEAIVNETENYDTLYNYSDFESCFTKKKKKNPKISDSSFSFPTDHISEDNYKEMSRK